MVAQRYRPILTLSQAPGVLVQLALDLVCPRTCVLKRARFRGDDKAPPDDPAVRLRLECELMRRMAGSGATPCLYDVIDDAVELTMVTEDLGTQTIEQHVGALSSRGERASPDFVIQCGLEVGRGLAAPPRSVRHVNMATSNRRISWSHLEECG